MKEKEKKKLHLRVVTVQHLVTPLGKSEQEKIKGGSKTSDSFDCRKTANPIYC